MIATQIQYRERSDRMPALNHRFRFLRLSSAGIRSLRPSAIMLNRQVSTHPLVFSSRVRLASQLGRHYFKSLV